MPASAPYRGCTGNTLHVICSGTLKAKRKPSGVWRKRRVQKSTGGELVEREIAADRGKRLGVFFQAIGLECLAREFAAREIPFAAVDLAKPALVLPGTAADVDVLRRKTAQTGGQRVAVEVTGLVEERTYHAAAARKKNGSAPASINPAGVMRTSTGAAPLA